MATAGSGLGQLGLWLHLRGRRGDGPALPAIPAGTDPAAMRQVAQEAGGAREQERPAAPDQPAGLLGRDDHAAGSGASIRRFCGPGG